MKQDMQIYQVFKEKPRKALKALNVAQVSRMDTDWKEPNLKEEEKKPRSTYQKKSQSIASKISIRNVGLTARQEAINPSPLHHFLLLIPGPTLDRELAWTSSRGSLLSDSPSSSGNFCDQQGQDWCSGPSSSSQEERNRDSSEQILPSEWMPVSEHTKYLVVQTVC